MITASRVLAIAASQVGYHEKASNAMLDDNTANSGGNNYTKYARDLAKAGYYQASKQGFDWCDMFVDWCFLQAANGDPVEAQRVECQTGLYGAGCDWSARYYREQGRYFTSNPQVGDQIFFGDFEHTGIIESVSDTHIHTIEGNKNNQVCRCTYSRYSSYITGFGRPKYDTTTAQATQPVFPAAPAAETCTVTLPVLRRSSQGGAVKALQTLLTATKIGTLTPDGDFGQATETVVRRYQGAHGLDVDGWVGAETWGELLK